ncbi:uncharacterized protein L201_004244 [Kwoniella dendrophila CBS 6074]|uniref:FAD/NAD(P)-binding domain-containing protein n=1 Tax=Kwoniella dendrophila CBS 6074 TaxID=1295534 RepID=A0AAX4JXR7_9TREE
MTPIAIHDTSRKELSPPPKAPLKYDYNVIVDEVPGKPDVCPTVDEPFSQRKEDGSYTVLNQPLGMRRKLRVVCVGAGASGINMAYKIQSHMKDVEFVTYDKNSDVGGTWFENRYPGVACDTNSHGYAFTYHLKADWTAIFSPGAEIEEYMRDVVKTYGLSKYIKLNHQVLGATWDAEKAKWHVKVRKGDDPNSEFVDTCDIFINASGLLNHWKMPDIPGLSKFRGKLIHTAAWPEDLDLKGKKVALIGIGSSAIQVLPQIQPLVESCSIYIRSPTWIAPSREGELLSSEQIKRYQDYPEEHLEYCRDLESLANKRFGYITRGSEDQKKLYEAWSNHMQKGLESRPEYYDKLHPTFGVGCRRPTPGPGFLEALTQPNVEAVFSGVDYIDETGLTTNQRDRREFDVIICATGFDVSFKPRFPVIGIDSINLQEQWSKPENTKAYLSMFTNNFPNYITVLGPGSPSAQGSIIVSIERISDYIIKFLNKFQHETIKTFEINKRCLDELNEHMQEQLKLTVWTDNCSSWFKNGNSQGPVIALHPGGRLHFFALLMDPRWEDFNYTYWNKNRYAYWGNGYTLREVE